MSQPDVIDPSALADIRDVGGDSLLAELIDILAKSAPRQLESIRTAVRCGDTAATARAAHALKSAVGNFGAHTLLEETAQLEAAARRGDCATLEWRLRAVEGHFELVSSRLQEILAAIRTDRDR